MTLRDRIRELANLRGLSLPKLEAELGFGNGTIVRWDNASPTAEKLQKVADYLDVSVDYLLGRESDIDDDLRKIERARNKMTPKDQKKMLNILKASFQEYFDDDYEEDDLDE